MAKKQTRRSISVSGDTYNAVRDYCDQHGLSASGLVTDLLNKYLVDNVDGPPPAAEQPQEPASGESPAPALAPGKSVARGVSSVRVSPPQKVRDLNYPDRRGPGFAPLADGISMANWLVTAHVEICRKRQIDAQTSVETLLENLMHRRMVSSAEVVKVEQLGGE